MSRPTPRPGDEIEVRANSRWYRCNVVVADQPSLPYFTVAFPDGSRRLIGGQSTGWRWPCWKLQTVLQAIANDPSLHNERRADARDALRLETRDRHCGWKSFADALDHCGCHIRRAAGLTLFPRESYARRIHDALVAYATVNRIERDAKDAKEPLS